MNKRTKLELTWIGKEQPQPQQKPLFDTEGERKTVHATLEVIKQFEKLSSSKDLQSQEI